MKKLILAAVAAASALVVALSFGSSHREAPLTSIDPTGDDTDVYAFTANDAPGALTIVSNWIPFEDPAGGPNFYSFDPKARYYLNVDNTGDGAYDVRYRFEFKTKIVNRNSFLYGLPGVSGVRDPKLNVQQSYDVVRETYGRGKLTRSRRIARNLPVAPNNVGPKTIPNYDAVAGQAVRTVKGGGKVFAGQREDPFFVDLGTTFDAIDFRPGTGTGNQGGGKDDLAGYNVHSIVLQVPESHVTRNGRSVSGPGASNAVIGVWSSTERRRVEVSNSSKERAAEPWVQVSRLGNPLINEVVIPLGQKDKFNRTQPQDDLKNFGKYALNPELAAVMNALFKVNAPEKNRTDIVQALLTGLPGKTAISKKPAPADTLKINLGVPPTAEPNRFGVLAGDLGGFPNGRRLTDDVVDIELQVVAGSLVGNKVPLGDGVDQNDKPFLGQFPYLASPFAGFDSQLKRMEPSHDAVPAP
jgi:Domain of unknown function (DUF4331)